MTNNENSDNDPVFWRHFEKIAAASIALIGLGAIVCGRDSYVVGIVGASLGYLFGTGKTIVTK